PTALPFDRLHQRVVEDLLPGQGRVPVGRVPFGEVIAAQVVQDRLDLLGFRIDPLGGFVDHAKLLSTGPQRHVPATIIITRSIRPPWGGQRCSCPLTQSRPSRTQSPESISQRVLMKYATPA